FVNDTTGVINQAPLTITATTNSKTFDCTTSAAAIPSVSGLQTDDSVTGLAEQYADANVGTGKTLNVTAYTVNDGNSGNNYIVTTQSDHTGVITQANTTATVTSTPNPSIVNQPVTFTATVAGTPAPFACVPTGTVTFKEGSTTLGTGTLNGSGQAT